MWRDGGQKRIITSLYFITFTCISLLSWLLANSTSISRWTNVFVKLNRITVFGNPFWIIGKSENTSLYVAGRDSLFQHALVYTVVAKSLFGEDVHLIMLNYKLRKKLLLSGSTSEIYLPSDRRLRAKLLTTFAYWGCHVVITTDTYGRILGFWGLSRYFFFQVAPQLYSRGWVDPVPDPLLLRKFGSAGNRTRDFWICSQELWPLDHKMQSILSCVNVYLILFIKEIRTPFL
jgi:hypothetical protein